MVHVPFQAAEGQPRAPSPSPTPRSALEPPGFFLVSFSFQLILSRPGWGSPWTLAMTDRTAHCCGISQKISGAALTLPVALGASLLAPRPGVTCPGPGRNQVVTLEGQGPRVSRGLQTSRGGPWPHTEGQTGGSEEVGLGGQEGAALALGTIPGAVPSQGLMAVARHGTRLKIDAARCAK